MTSKKYKWLSYLNCLYLMAGLAIFSIHMYSSYPVMSAIAIAILLIMAFTMKGVVNLTHACQPHKRTLILESLLSVALLLTWIIVEKEGNSYFSLFIGGYMIIELIYDTVRYRAYSKKLESDSIKIDRSQL